MPNSARAALICAGPTISLTSGPISCTFGPTRRSKGLKMEHLALSIETSKFLRLKQRLMADYPRADEETLLDTLEGITNLHEMIAAVIRSALVDEALRAGLRTRLE